MNIYNTKNTIQLGDKRIKTSIIKQDINFYDKPLWFQNIKHDGTALVWVDIDGYEYRSSYKLPDKVDMLILFYLMLKSQTNGYQTKLELTRYEILAACGLSIDSQHYVRVKDCLKRWKNVSIEFQGTFYDGKKYIAIGFGIVDNYKIDDRTKRITIWLNENWMLKVKESNFFKYLNFEYYKSLKRPISRRLYEILSPKSYDGKEWSISLTKLGAKLPIYKRIVHTREGEKKVLYASDVLVAIKPAINEINNLAKKSNIREKAEALPGDVFTINYHITGKKQDRVIHFTKQLVLSKQKHMQSSNSHQKISQNQEEATIKETTSSNPQPDPPESPKFESNDLEKLIALTRYKRIPAAQRDRLVRLLEKEGFDYCQANIEYANARANTNYSAYLAGALDKNQAEYGIFDAPINKAERQRKKAEEAWKKYQAMSVNDKQKLQQQCEVLQIAVKTSDLESERSIVSIILG